MEVEKTYSSDYSHRQGIKQICFNKDSTPSINSCNEDSSLVKFSVGPLASTWVSAFLQEPYS